MVKLISIDKSPNPKKKLRATFYIPSQETFQHIDFGAADYEDYTTHKDKDRRQRYIDRHKKNEDWNMPISAGALSRWILWGDYTDLNKNIQAYKKKFNL